MSLHISPSRWAAAKGVGQLAIRLPRDAVDDVLEAIIQVHPPTRTLAFALEP